MKTENRFAEAAKRGFTLIELLVVVAILGILGAVAVQQLMGATDGAKLTTAKQSVDNIKSGVIQYQIRRNKLPNSLTDLVTGDNPIIEGGEDALNDPWGQPYQMKKNGQKFYIVSGGPDMQVGNEDDIRSDKAMKQSSEQ